MPWNETTRREYERRGGRYASDVTDREWTLVAPFPPAAKRIGRPRTTDLRDVLDTIVYMATTGCQWAMPPNDFPPPSTVQRSSHDWRDSGVRSMAPRRPYPDPHPTPRKVLLCLIEF